MWLHFDEEQNNWLLSIELGIVTSGYRQSLLACLQEVVSYDYSLEVDPCTAWIQDHNNSMVNNFIPPHLELEWAELCIGSQRWVDISSFWRYLSMYCVDKYLVSVDIYLKLWAVNNMFFSLLWQEVRRCGRSFRQIKCVYKW